MGGCYGMAKKWFGSSGCGIMMNFICGAILGAFVITILLFACLSFGGGGTRVSPSDG